MINFNQFQVTLLMVTSRGENIGDIGGLSLAYRAYQMSLNGEEAPIIDGLTGTKGFSCHGLQVWQRKYREDALIQRLTSDPHSPLISRQWSCKEL